MTVIDPNGVYTVESAAKVLNIPERALRNAIRAGELTVSKRARTHFLTGRWLLAWIEDGRVRRPAGDAEAVELMGTPLVYEFKTPGPNDPAA
jgi:hypothetical protein